jgi:hypothetical protein
LRKEARTPLLILIIGIALTIVAAWLLIQDWSAITFKNTSQIGDTIGAITSPIVALIGSILVYKVLQAQIIANKIITDPFEELTKEQIQLNTSLSGQKMI